MRIIVSILCLFLALPVLADSDSIKIAAVVNDQVISSIDLNQRVTLIMALTGIPDTDEARTKFTPQILRQMIDEKLELQDAAAHSITVTDEKVKEAIAKIEKQNNKPAGSLPRFIEDRHLSLPSFMAQVRGQVAWSEIITKQIRPDIRISDQEVARYKRNLAVASGGNTDEVQINVILLPVDSPSNAASVARVAGKLADEIHAGASFEDVAAQFSSNGGVKSPGAFWVDRSQLDPAVAAAIAKIGKNGVTDPVKTDNGYELIKLMDSRKKSGEGTEAEAQQTAPQPRSELAFKQIVMTPRPKAKKLNAEALQKQAREVAEAPGSCVDKAIKAKGDWADLNIDVNFIRRMSTDLPDKLRDLLVSMKVGAVSEPVVTPKDVRLYMLCERVEMPPEKAPPAPAISPEDLAIRQKIYEEKMELGAQKYLQNLRRDAFIDVRL